MPCATVSNSCCNYTAHFSFTLNKRSEILHFKHSDGCEMFVFCHRLYCTCTCIMGMPGIAVAMGMNPGALGGIGMA